MTEDQEQLLRKAIQNLSAAHLLVQNGHPDIAASRAYYAMFYVAEAFLLGEGLTFSSHSAVSSAFGHHLAKTGKVPAEFHRMLMDAREIREDGDYGGLHTITPEQADKQIRCAERFIELAHDLLGTIPPPPHTGS